MVTTKLNLVALSLITTLFLLSNTALAKNEGMSVYPAYHEYDDYYSVPKTELYNRHEGIYLSGHVGFPIFISSDVSGSVPLLGYGAIAGYQFNDYLAVEGGVMSVMLINTSMWHAAVKGILPVGNNVSFYAKAGVGHFSFPFDADSSKDDDYDEKLTTTGPFFGLGIEFAITKNFGIGLEYNGTILTNDFHFDWNDENKHEVKSKVHAAIGLASLCFTYHF